MDNFERDQKESYADDVRLRLQEYMIKSNVTQLEVSKETGIHHSTLTQWLLGKIQGHHVKVSETIEHYLDFIEGQTKAVSYTFSRNRFEMPPDEGTRFSNDVDMEDETGFGTLVPVKVDYETEGKKKDLLLLDK